MQYVLLIYQGSTPLPNTPEWDTLPKEEQKAIYADYAALNQDSRITGGPPLGLPDSLPALADAPLPVGGGARQVDELGAAREPGPPAAVVGAPAEVEVLGTK